MTHPFRPRAGLALFAILAVLSASALAGSHTAELPIDVRVSQGGAFAGIRNTLHSVWLPPGQAFKGLSGQVALTGNHPGFSEALVMLGYAGQDPSACARMDGAVIPGMPVITRLWAGILKSNDTMPVSMPAAVDLDTPVSPARPETGVCLATLISAGYPFLRRDVALYTTTDVRLRVATAPPTGPVVTFGMGGEFRLSGDPAAPRAAYVGIEARRPLIVDGLAAFVSAASVAGAPVASHWSAGAPGRWGVGTSFVVVPGGACRAARFAGHTARPDFYVLRSAAPSQAAPPPGSVRLLDLPLASHDLVATQATRFEASGSSQRKARLAIGDCLMVFERAAVSGGAGQIDVENQSTVYLREAK